MVKSKFRNISLEGLLAIIVFLYSCNGENNQSNFVNKQFEIFDIELLFPTRIASVGSYTIIIDSKDEYFLHLLKGSTKVFSGFKLGKGPAELVSPFSIHVKSNSEFWIHDAVQNVFQEYSIENDSIKLGKRTKIEQRIIIPEFLNDSSIIGFDYSAELDSWISLFAEDGSFKETFLPFPNSDLFGAKTLNMQAFQANLKVKPDKEKIVVCNRYSDRLTVYSKNGEEIYTYRSEDSFEPIMKVAVVHDYPTLSQGEETRIGFTDVAVSNHYIFATFSGKSRKEPNPTFTDLIFKFDWDGNLIQKYKCDYPIILMSFSDEEGMIFALISKDLETKLAKVKL